MEDSKKGKKMIASGITSNGATSITGTSNSNSNKKYDGSGPPLDPSYGFKGLYVIDFCFYISEFVWEEKDYSDPKTAVTKCKQLYLNGAKNMVLTP